MPTLKTPSPFPHCALAASCLLLGCFVKVSDDDSQEPAASGFFANHDRSNETGATSNDSNVEDYPGNAGDSQDTWERSEVDTDPLDGQYRSLLVVDPELLRTGSDNLDPDAPYSFRKLMAWLGQSENPDQFVYEWLRHWEQGGSVAGLEAPGQSAVYPALMQGWIEPAPRPAGGDEPEGEAMDAGSTDSSEYEGDEVESAAYPHGFTLHWADAPFRLIAIVPRVDLANEPCEGRAGELRFVFTGSDWRYDEELELTLILEIELPQSATPATWAQRFQQLEALAAPDYATQLAVLARDVLSTAEPLATRLRTNEAALSGPGEVGWRLREFRPRIVDGSLSLLSAPLSSTPSPEADLNQVAAHLLDNSQQVRQGPVALPEDLQAAVANLPADDFRWTIPGLSQALNQAFSVNTCNGCHGGDTQALPFQHLAPGASAQHPARISSFLYDPDADTDELRRRQAKLYALSEAACPEPPAPSTYP